MKIYIAELLDGKIAFYVPGMSFTVDEVIDSLHGLILKNEGVFIGTVDRRADINYLFGVKA